MPSPMPGDTFAALAELADPVARTADAMVECLCAGRKLLVCGNGGSAADGADFSAEFGCRFMTDRRPYPALNLAQGGSLMSAIGNDYGFRRSLRAAGRRTWTRGRCPGGDHDQRQLEKHSPRPRGRKRTRPNDRLAFWGAAAVRRKEWRRSSCSCRATRRRESRRRISFSSTSSAGWSTRGCRKHRRVVRRT